MKTKSGWLLILLAGLLMASPAAWADKGETKESETEAEAPENVEPPAEETMDSDAASESTPAPLFNYVPPDRGAPSNRIGGGTRGDDGEFLVVALVPEDHIGRTTRESPVLVWYRAPTAKGTFEFSLNDETGGTVLARKTLTPPEDGGYATIDTGELEVRLSPDRLYSWFVTLVVDPADPSLDKLSGGYIQRVEMPQELGKSLFNAAPASRAAGFAQAGIWYDALAVLTAQIQARPESETLRENRVTLLKAVNLPALPE
jgi:hypothetical protein